MLYLKFLLRIDLIESICSANMGFKYVGGMIIVNFSPVLLILMGQGHGINAFEEKREKKEGDEKGKKSTVSIANLNA